MIIRPAEKRLFDSIGIIQNSNEFSFLIQPTTVVLPGINVRIRHISMMGPRRDWAQGTNIGNNYKGPYWESSIWLYPSFDFDDVKEASEYFQNDLLGRASKVGRPLRWRNLRYDFQPEAQPEREDEVDRIPYLINFLVEPPEETKKVEERKNAHLEWGELGDYSERILFPPSPWNYWESMPATRRMIQESIESGNVKNFK